MLNTINCSRCGQASPIAAHYCRRCGSPLEVLRRSVRRVESGSLAARLPSPRRRGMPWPGLLVAFIFFLIIMRHLASINSQSVCPFSDPPWDQSTRMTHPIPGNDYSPPEVSVQPAAPDNQDLRSVPVPDGSIHHHHHYSSDGRP